MIKHFLFAVGLLSLVSTISHGSHTKNPETFEESGGRLRCLVDPVERGLKRGRISNIRREITNNEFFDHRSDLKAALRNSSSSLTSVTYLRGSSQLRRVPYLISKIEGNVGLIDSSSKIFAYESVEYNQGSMIKISLTHEKASPEIYEFKLTLRSCELTSEEKSVILENVNAPESSPLTLHFLIGRYKVVYSPEISDLLKKVLSSDQKVYLQRLQPFNLSRGYNLATFAYDDGKEPDGKLPPLPTFDLYLRFLSFS